MGKQWINYLFNRIFNKIILETKIHNFKIWRDNKTFKMKCRNMRWCAIYYTPSLLKIFKKCLSKMQASNSKNSILNPQILLNLNFSLKIHKISIAYIYLLQLWSSFYKIIGQKLVEKKRRKSGNILWIIWRMQIMFYKKKNRS